MERAKEKFDEIDGVFGDFFGRSYVGQIEAYRMEDAEIALVTSGSAAGTAKTVIDSKRDEGIKVGLVKLRMFRPFPGERLTEILGGRRAIGVIDRSVCFGWNCGPIYMELRSLLPEIGLIPVLGFIDGLAGLDITRTHVEGMTERVHAASQGKPYQKVTWVNLEG
jgi:pyruvate/2-oxoacid:ferredoxin oxidoreductase alpha subunit